MTRLSAGMSGNRPASWTALTPGSAIALSVLIETIRAWACGLRLILPQHAGHFHVGTEIGPPGDLVTPSGRMGRVPTIFNVSLSR